MQEEEEGQEEGGQQATKTGKSKSKPKNKKRGWRGDAVLLGAAAHEGNVSSEDESMDDVGSQDGAASMEDSDAWDRGGGGSSDAWDRGGSDDDDASDRDGGGGATSLEAVRDKAQRTAAGEQLVRREAEARAGELLTRLEAAETAREQLDEELRHRLEDERLESESRSAGVSASSGSARYHVQFAT